MHCVRDPRRKLKNLGTLLMVKRTVISIKLLPILLLFPTWEEYLVMVMMITMIMIMINVI